MVALAQFDVSLVPDQASELRRLKANCALRANGDSEESTRRCRSLVICGSKGGVGKSVVALHLAVGLANCGARTGIFDATTNVADVSLMCGQTGYWNLEHVLAGTRTLDQVMIDGPHGIQILSGGRCLMDFPGSLAISRTLEGSLRQFEEQFDWLVADTSALTPSFAGAADGVLIVTTPEPTAIAAAYADLKTLASLGITRSWLVINQSESKQQAQLVFERLRETCRSFLGTTLLLAGAIPEDDAVRLSVSQRCTLLDSSSESEAAIAFDRMAQRVVQTIAIGRSDGFFRGIISRYFNSNVSAAVSL